MIVRKLSIYAEILNYWEALAIPRIRWSLKEVIEIDVIFEMKGALCLIIDFCCLSVFIQSFASVNVVYHRIVHFAFTKRLSSFPNDPTKECSTAWIKSYLSSWAMMCSMQYFIIINPTSSLFALKSVTNSHDFADYWFELDAKPLTN